MKNLVHMSYENLKGKNKYFTHIEVPQISMLPKHTIGRLELKDVSFCVAFV